MSLHQSTGSASHFAENEFVQIKKQLEYERTLPNSWASLYTVPSYRKRAIVGFLTMFCAQCSGTQVINSKLPPSPSPNFPVTLPKQTPV